MSVSLAKPATFVSLRKRAADKSVHPAPSVIGGHLYRR